MRHEIFEKVEIPNGILCSYEDEFLICRKNSEELKRKIKIPEVKIKVDGNYIIFKCEKGKKEHYKKILANIKQMLKWREMRL